MDKTNLGNRMKAYEAIHKNFLMRRQPVIIRLDGKAFHSFTKGFDKPFDDEFIVAMQRTMKYLLEQEKNTRDFSHEMNFLADSKCIEKSVHSGEKSSNKET